MATELDASDVQRARLTLYWGMDYYTANSRSVEVSGSYWPSLAGYSLSLVDRTDTAVQYTTLSAPVTGAGQVQVVRLELSASDTQNWGRGRHQRRIKGTNSSRDVILAELWVDVL